MSNLRQRLQEASEMASKKNLNISITYGDLKLFESEFDMPQYAEEVFEQDVSLYYFFMDLKKRIEDKVAEEHKKIMFKKANEND